MIHNVAFDTRLVHYAPEYENSLHFSDQFQRYAEALADDLIDRFSLRGKTVIELGCGKGEFLALLSVPQRHLVTRSMFLHPWIDAVACVTQDWIDPP